MAIELQEYAKKNATKDYEKENLRFYDLLIKKEDMDRQDNFE